MTTIAAWNLHHATDERKIPDEVTTVIESLKPDVLVLTEYVDGASRLGFKDALRSRLGFNQKIGISETVVGQNHVLIASKASQVAPPVRLPCPTFTKAAETNFLHRYLPDIGLDVVGFRVPDYKPAAQRASYWEQLEVCILAARDRNAVFIGDFNWQPSEKRTASALAIKRIKQAGFQVVTPDEPWSFINAKGTGTSKIDHAVLTPSLSCRAARYIYKEGDVVLAGPSRDKPVSDHALLWLDVINRADA